ncbi:hypothetical protein BC332_00862 [Capsicum chinense]|nr:hypothetical protein BC332_00862 [Capsicum chinense]
MQLIPSNPSLLQPLVMVQQNMINCQFLISTKKRKKIDVTERTLFIYSTYVESVLSYVESVAIDVGSITKDMESVALDVESVAPDLESVAIDVESVAPDLESVRIHQTSLVTEFEKSSTFVIYSNN